MKEKGVSSFHSFFLLRHTNVKNDPIVENREKQMNLFEITFLRILKVCDQVLYEKMIYIMQSTPYDIHSQIQRLCVSVCMFV